MVSFGDTAPNEALRANFDAALAQRELWVAGSTDAYRIVNAEADGIAGLVMDRYADMLVLQVSTLGMRKLKPFILEMLESRLAPGGIHEKSDSAARREEGLAAS